MFAVSHLRRSKEAAFWAPGISFGFGQIDASSTILVRTFLLPVILILFSSRAIIIWFCLLAVQAINEMIKFSSWMNVM
ncbi:hypothetical protein LCGC14_2683210, partial [marine sediment metagenome]